MIEGVIGICAVCGGEVTVHGDMVDAHRATASEIHIVWQHLRCNLVAEVTLSVQDYKAALSFMRQESGRVVERMPSEGEEMLMRFCALLEQVENLEDFGWGDERTDVVY